MTVLLRFDPWAAIGKPAPEPRRLSNFSERSQNLSEPAGSLGFSELSDLSRREADAAPFSRPTVLRGLELDLGCGVPGWRTDRRIAQRLLARVRDEVPERDLLVLVERYVASIAHGMRPAGALLQALRLARVASGCPPPPANPLGPGEADPGQRHGLQNRMELRK